MADNYKDFDASQAENEEEELEFLLGGKKYSLPAQYLQELFSLK